MTGEERRALAEEALEEQNPDALFMDGLDEAIVGVAMGLVVYDRDLIIKTLMERDEMTREDAWEHYGYNIESAYVGENTPIILAGFRETPTSD